VLIRLISIASVFLLMSCSQLPTRTWELPAGAKSINVNGYDMAYVERGSGEPLVLVHGSLSDFRFFAAAMEPLSSKYRVISVSLRHYYPEPWNGKGGDFSLKQHSSDVAAFLRTLNAGPVHLVGHSRGGSLVLYVATAHPELVRSLTVAEGGTSMPAFDESMSAPSAAGAKGKQRIANTLAMLEQGKTDEGLNYFIDDVGGPGSWRAASESVRQMFRDNAWSLKGADLDTFEPYSCADAGRIRAPILLLRGEKTPQTFTKMLEVMAGCMKNADRAIVAGASHGSPRLNPKGFAEAVIVFTSNH
jgi:esterase